MILRFVPSSSATPQTVRDVCDDRSGGRTNSGKVYKSNLKVFVVNKHRSVICSTTNSRGPGRSALKQPIRFYLFFDQSLSEVKISVVNLVSPLCCKIFTLKVKYVFGHICIECLFKMGWIYLVNARRNWTRLCANSGICGNK